jgi:hypothetical protein
VEPGPFKEIVSEVEQEAGDRQIILPVYAITEVTAARAKSNPTAAE